MVKRRIENDLLDVHIDSESAVPKHVQIVSQIRQLVASGMLRPKARLPSTRHLADVIGVSRVTVACAYDQLLAEGYLVAQVGSGTTVAEQLKGVAHPRHSAVTAKVKRGAHDVPDTAKRVSAFCTLMPPPTHRIFSIGTQGEDTSPGKVWDRHLLNAARRLRLESGYVGPQGLPELRQAIVDYAQRARGVSATPEQVIVTSGTQQGLALTVKVLLAAGDKALVEDPGYLPLRALLIDAGVKITGMRVDSDGARIPLMPRASAQPRAMFLTPSHQYPLGMVLSMQRRFAALQWARASGGWIVEDDYDSEFRYAGQPYPALQGLDRDGCVIYLGSFSKALSPALRLGYLIVPECLVDAFAGAKRLADLHSPLLEQIALEQFIVSGDFEAHVRRVRLLMEERHNTLCDLIATRLSKRLTLLRCDQGLFVSAQLNSGIDLEISERAAAVGLTARPLSIHYLRNPAMHGFMLGFANLHHSEISSAVSRFAAVM